MTFDEQKVNAAIQKVEDLCLHCEDHKFTCYVAVAKRAMATLVKVEESAERDEEK